MGVSILYACESGSRAWGFASPNSDFDIRFLYRSRRECYLSVFEQKDTIEIPIKDDLDPGGWDIKKALGLLAKSNGALIEWLHSPIIYKDEGNFRCRWQSLSEEIFNPNDLINHYRGLAMQITRRKLDSDSPSVKGYLYACRALLSARWVERNITPPPVPFTELLDEAASSLRSVLEEAVEWKATADEIASMGRINALDTFIQAELEKEPPSLTTPCKDMVRERVDAEFLSLIRE